VVVASAVVALAVAGVDSVEVIKFEKREKALIQGEEKSRKHL